MTNAIVTLPKESLISRCETKPIECRIYENSQSVCLSILRRVLNSAYNNFLCIAYVNLFLCKGIFYISVNIKV